MSERMEINETCRELAAGAALTGFDDWMNVAREDETPAGREESLTVFRLGGAGGFRVYLKRYRPARPRLRFFLRPSRQTCEAENAKFLRELGLPSAEVVAAGERRRFGCVAASFVATREIPDATPLSVLGPGLLAKRSKEARRARLEIIAKLAGIVRRMHDAGYVDFDLYCRNVLVTETPGGTHELYKIDSPRGGRPLLGRRRGMLRDLACLNRDARTFLSKTDRVRFIQAYLRRERLRVDDRRLCRRIDRRKPPREEVSAR